MSSGRVHRTRKQDEYLLSLVLDLSQQSAELVEALSLHFDNHLGQVT